MSPRQFMIANVSVLLGYLLLATSTFTGLRLRSIFLLVVLFWVGLGLLLSKTRLAQIEGGVFNRRKMLGISAVCLFSLLTFLAADLCYGIYYNLAIRQPREAARTLDPQLTAPELASSLPACERDGTPFHKPGVQVEGTITGNMFVPSTMDGAAADLSDIVEPRHVRYAINNLGLRRATTHDGPPDEAEIVALGDSFTFGNGVDGDQTWVHRLGQRTGRGVLNVGFSGSGPVDELARLKWLLSHAQMKPTQVVWLIFEGNDLTDERLLLTPPTVSSATEETLLQALFDGLEIVKRRSIIGLAIQSQLILNRRSPWAGAETRLKTGALLFDCGPLGRKLFFPGDLEAASLTPQQVRRHAGFARMRAAFAEMEQIAKEWNFKVLVTVAPTDARVLAPFCQALSHISTDSPLENEVRVLADRHHMQFVSLVKAFQNAASQKRLYFRDDTHWNPAGHQLTADTIAAALSSLKGE